MLNNKLLTRPDWILHPDYFYTYARAGIRLYDMPDKPFASFLPPIEMLIYVHSDEKRVQYLLRLVQLWPHLLREW